MNNVYRSVQAFATNIIFFALLATIAVGEDLPFLDGVIEKASHIGVWHKNSLDGVWSCEACYVAKPEAAIKELMHEPSARMVLVLLRNPLYVGSSRGNSMYVEVLKFSIVDLPKQPSIVIWRIGGENVRIKLDELRQILDARTKRILGRRNSKNEVGNRH